MVSQFGALRARSILRNLGEAQLFEQAVRREEGLVSQSGALVVETGSNTGRSAQDKFIVLDAATENTVWWGGNKRMTRAQFEVLHSDVMRFMEERDVFIQDLWACADPNHRLGVRVVTQYAWHSLFARHLFIVPTEPDPDFASFDLERRGSNLLVIDLPEFEASQSRHGARTGTMIACDLARRVVIIVGTAYAGEIKKSVFTVLNFILPEAGVMPMHCSVNVGPGGEDPAVFFGLSGTGKTTLSADPERVLIGDDEHGWSDEGLFNFEGGCYAKVIRLSRKNEPQIYAASERFGTILENVVVDPRTRRPDVDSDALTENTRAAYPVACIANASPEGRTTHPRNVVLLTADAFGVMPPVSLLDSRQAVYHFLSGYTARVAGTEKGSKKPEATFSACFGAAFMARHPCSYGKLLRGMLQKHNATCWLLNTGWTGGPYGVGRRIAIGSTRLILRAILDGSLAKLPMRRDDVFGFMVPTHIDGLDEDILDPRKTWSDPSEYDAALRGVARLFEENFERLRLHESDPDLAEAGPHVR